MNGIIIINKPENYTSRDIVNIISKEFKTKKVGHTGTLDPMATGVLVVCIGEATKIAELLTATNKEYIADITFGINTDTLDMTGSILEKKEAILNKEEIIFVLKKMTKTYMQEVPIYSAVKVNGKKLYEYARNNEEIVLPKKEVTIKNIELLDYKIKNNQTKIKIKCLVSKGTYIRSLIRDIAKELNSVATMTSLVRTKQGKFIIEKSYNLEDIKKNNYNLITIEESLDLPEIIVDDNLEKKIKNGSILENKYQENPILFKNKKNEILAIYKKYEKDNTKIKPWKMFNR